MVVGFLALWEVLARTLFSGRFLIPPPETVFWGIWQDRGIYQYSVPTTVHEAALGFLWGNLAAILVALLFLLVPITERIGMGMAIVSYCLPVVAIAPILQILLTGESPKIGLAAISVFFTTLIIVLTGLRSADPVSLELIKVYGGGSLSAAADADAIVASYRATQLFSFLPYQLLLSITFILFPLLAKAHREGNRQDVALFIKSGIRIALIVAGAIISITAGIPGALLRLVFTADIAEPAISSMGLLTLGFGAFAIFGILTTALTSLQRERLSAMVTALAVALVVSLAVVLVRGQPFGVKLLWRMAVATSCGLVLATLAASLLVYRFTGALITVGCFLRVSVSLAATIGLGRIISPWLASTIRQGGMSLKGLLAIVASAAALECLYLILLTLLRELNRSDLGQLVTVLGRQRAKA